MSDETYQQMSYTIELSDEEGKQLIAGLERNNIYGDGEALGAIQNAVAAGRLTATPTAFRVTGPGCSEVVRITALADMPPEEMKRPRESLGGGGTA
jgi:hypothetical protein